MRLAHRRRTCSYLIPCIDHLDNGRSELVGTPSQLQLVQNIDSTSAAVIVPQQVGRGATTSSTTAIGHKKHRLVVTTRVCLYLYPLPLMRRSAATALLRVVSPTSRWGQAPTQLGLQTDVMGGTLWGSGGLRWSVRLDFGLHFVRTQLHPEKIELM